MFATASPKPGFLGLRQRQPGEGGRGPSQQEVWPRQPEDSKLFTSCSRYSFRKRYSSSSRLRPRRSGRFLCKSNRSSEAASRQFSWDRCCSSWKRKVKEKLIPIFRPSLFPDSLKLMIQVVQTLPTPSDHGVQSTLLPPPICPMPSAPLLTVPESTSALPAPLAS